ncbi:MAG: hypothetical protein HQL69_21445 [Magnetococcales bacterium]|nr:hypothetical protein [Magnetococcales bacterium]
MKLIAKLKKTFFLLFFFLSLSAMFGPVLLENYERAKNPYIYSSDARQSISYFYKHQDPDLFPDTYALEYFNELEAYGYRAFFKIGSYFMDVGRLSKVLPFVLLGLTLTFLALAAFQISGLAGAWAVVAISLSSGFLLQALGGATPRAFAYPLVVLAIYALTLGRIYLLFLCVVAGTLFYPMAGVLIGANIVAVLFLLPKEDRGDAKEWSLKKRVLLTLGLIILSLSILQPQMSGLKEKYGRSFTQDDCSTVPEIGLEGRMGAIEGMCGDIPHLPEELLAHSKHAILFVYGAKTWSIDHYELAQIMLRDAIGNLDRDDLLTIIIWLFVTVGISYRAFWKNDSVIRRWLSLLAVSCVAYIIARAFVPTFYFPNRYLYPVGPLFILFIFAATHITPELLAKKFPRLNQKWIKPYLIVGVTITLLLFLGSHGNPNGGLPNDRQFNKQIYKFVATLPKDVVIAGWPKGALEDLPLITQRQNFASHSHHHTFHLGFVLEMRRRTTALINAYFATSIEPIKNLKDSYGVTHLIIHKALFKDYPPRHFSPFFKMAIKKREMGRKDGFEALRQAEFAAVFKWQDYVILDLSLLKVAG